MKIKNRNQYKEWFDHNTEPYGRRCLTYGEDWANLMEEKLETLGYLNKEIIDQLSNQADTDGITGFMFGASKRFLFECWVYSDYIEYYYSNISMERKKQIERQWKLRRILG